MLVFVFQFAKAQLKGEIELADPTIFYYNKIYYLYGTVEENSNLGFIVYTSKDKSHWQNMGTVLKKRDAFGTKGFWAPQVFRYRKKFYMAYVANEQIAIGEASSPLGPFKQPDKKPIAGSVKMIDPFIFFDKGKIFLYHVRLQDGNRIYVAEMNKDLRAIVKGTDKECLKATADWENTSKTDWGVTEGPTVIRKGGKYYLFYSANDFRNPDYAVGYATANNPMGPWKKYKGNPILSKEQTGVNGTGHGDFFIDGGGKLAYVFHTHQSNQKVAPRRTAIIDAKFIKAADGAYFLKMQANTFNYLNDN